MKYIIVGCGRAGSTLANRLFRDGHTVTVIDNRREAFNNLSDDFRGHTLESNVLEEGVLRRAGIETADGLAAVTNSDVLNAVVGHIARTIYHVPGVVVRNYDPQLRGLHEAFALQAVSSTAWGAQKVEEMLAAPGLKTVFSAGNGEIKIYEIRIPAAWEGRPLQQLIAAVQPLTVIALSRAGKAFLPPQTEVLHQGDVLHIGASFEAIGRLQQRLTHSEEV